LLEHRAAMLALIARQPDLTLQKLRRELAAIYGVSVGTTSLWRFLKIQQIRLRVGTRPNSLKIDDRSDDG
jgi:transposase